MREGERAQHAPSAFLLPVRVVLRTNFFNPLRACPMLTLSLSKKKASAHIARTKKRCAAPFVVHTRAGRSALQIFE